MLDQQLEGPLSSVTGQFPGARRRELTNLFMHGLLLLVMIATVGVLVWVLAYVAGQGLKYLGPEFLTQTPPGNPSEPGGGFLNGIIGSVITTGIATVLSVPAGAAAAIYLVEYGGRLARVTRFLTDILVGVPTIVTGALVYAVCSTDPRETVEVIEWFTTRHNFERGIIPAPYESLLTDAGDVLVPPGLNGRDGFFIVMESSRNDRETDFRAAASRHALAIPKLAYERRL